MDFLSKGFDDDSSKNCDKTVHNSTAHRELVTVIAGLGVVTAILLLVTIIPFAKGYKSFLQ